MSKGILLMQGTDEVFEQFGPFATIFCQTEEDFKHVKEAVEKQEPKKAIKSTKFYRPNTYKGTREYVDECPICKEIVYHGENYCKNCGQKLDRSE